MSAKAMTNNKPYLIRALHEWICDNHCTPYLYVNTQAANLRLPSHLAAENPLILNISPNACKDLQLDNDGISFQARFSGQVFSVYLPIASIMAIIARENGQGMTFADWPDDDDGDDDGPADDGVDNSDSDKQSANAKKTKPSGLKVIR